MNIVEFLTVRLDEDEAVARAAGASRWVEQNGEVRADGKLVACGPLGFGMEDDLAAHVARQDPARVLGDVAAKRAIIRECEPYGRLTDDEVLLYLAAVYSDHPDYQDEWKP